MPESGESARRVGNPLAIDQEPGHSAEQEEKTRRIRVRVISPQANDRFCLEQEQESDKDEDKHGVSNRQR